MVYLMGIDVGTSGTRTLICDEKGTIAGSATVEHPISSPKPGWSEQHPEDWWKATAKSVRTALRKAKLKGRDIAGLGLSGQMHGSVFLDKNDRVLRPAILWNDQRTGKECEEITATIGKRRLIKLVSNPALTGFTAPKILWVRNHEPRVYGKTKKVLLPKDYIRFRLTGTFATEVSDASGTLLLDVKKRRWSRQMLSGLQIDEALLPECYESPEVSGKISKIAAKETGLAEGTPVVGGGGDQAAGAVGNGIVKKGVISATMGTSGVVFAFSDTVATDPLGRAHTFCHAVPGKWHIMGVVLAAGGSFQWFRNKLGEREVAEAKKKKVDPYELLTAEAEKAPVGSEGLIFLPYLTGERTPHADPDARGAWVGLSMRHGRNELIRSVMEGATYAMKDSFEIIRNLGVPIKEVRLSGGGARSAFWRQMQADIYEANVCTINATEGPAFGVALLAGVGTGVFKTVEEACEATIRVVTRTRVNKKNASVYAKYYPIFQNLYRSLKNDYKSIAEVVHGA
jgi:xylulokinase